jgi:hypothetical protein
LRENEKEKEEKRWRMNKMNFFFMYESTCGWLPGELKL